MGLNGTVCLLVLKKKGKEKKLIRGLFVCVSHDTVNLVPRAFARANKQYNFLVDTSKLMILTCGEMQVDKTTF